MTNNMVDLVIRVNEGVSGVSGHASDWMFQVTSTGPRGPTGKSAYEAAVEGGFAGSEQEFNQALGTQSTGGIVQVGTLAELPNLGNPKLIYAVSRDPNGGRALYCWDTKRMVYEPYGADFHEIKVIRGGNAIG